MQIIPAIDLRGGKVVRLLRGEYDQETIYSDNPIEIACRWQAAGSKLIHLVDLDGARDGEMSNRQAIQTIVQSVQVQTELGGGLRTLESIEYVLETLGVNRAVLGSILLENPQLVREAAERFPHRIVLGIDARDGLVATRGWRTTSTVKAVNLLREFPSLPIAAVIYTDIARDGTLEGPNLAAITEMAAVSPYPLIASGGIGSLEHIHSLRDLSQKLFPDKLVGVIVGKALYDGRIILGKV